MILHVYMLEYSLSAWRSELGRRFFRSFTQSDINSRHLPQWRDSEIFSRFDNTLPTQYPELRLTNIALALAKYQ